MESMNESARPHPSQRRYPPELRERAVRMALERMSETGERHGAVVRVAGQLGIGTESLRRWVIQAEIDRGSKAGLTTEERERMKELERENRELRRANEILKSAAALFGAELDRRSTRRPPTSTRTAPPTGSSRSAGGQVPGRGVTGRRPRA